jgi:hypothetical protein
VLLAAAVLATAIVLRPTAAGVEAQAPAADLTETEVAYREAA